MQENVRNQIFFNKMFFSLTFPVLRWNSSMKTEQHVFRRKKNYSEKLI